MGIEGLSEFGGMEALEATIRFSGRRQRLVAHNIANISTPDFLQTDLSVKDFQAELGRVIDDRRERGSGKLDLSTVGQAEPTQRNGILFPDHNNRDVERLMQDQAENLMVYRTAIDLLRSRAEMMRSTLAGRV